MTTHSHQEVSPIKTQAEVEAERTLLALEAEARRYGQAAYRFDPHWSDELVVRLQPAYVFRTKGGGSGEVDREGALRMLRVSPRHLQPSGRCDICVHGTPFEDDCKECAA